MSVALPRVDASNAGGHRRASPGSDGRGHRHCAGAGLADTLAVTVSFARLYTSHPSRSAEMLVRGRRSPLAADRVRDASIVDLRSAPRSPLPRQRVLDPLRRLSPPAASHVRATQDPDPRKLQWRRGQPHRLLAHCATGIPRRTSPGGRWQHNQDHKRHGCRRRRSVPRAGMMLKANSSTNLGSILSAESMVWDV